MKKLRPILLLEIVSLLCVFSSIPVYAGTWNSNTIGWWYQEDNGTYPVSAWKYIDGKWYRFDNHGYMLANNWLIEKHNYYYFYSDGSMAVNAWIDDLFYVGADGKMYTDTFTPDGYYVGGDGKYIPDEETQNPMAGINCTSMWEMWKYKIDAAGKYFKITGDVYDIEAKADYLGIVGSGGDPDDYPDLDTGLRKKNVTIYVPLDMEVTFWPEDEESVSWWEEQLEHRALYGYKKANTAADFFMDNNYSSYGKDGYYYGSFAFELNGNSNTVSKMCDSLFNYVN